MSRRRFVAGGAVLAASTVWRPLFTLQGAAAEAACAPLPDFPIGIPLYLQGFENWARDIVVDQLWTSAPRTAGEVAAIATWAKAHGYRVRPRGMMHNWSPLTVTSAENCGTKVVMVDTTRSLTGVDIVTVAGKPAVRAQAGVTMDTLLQFIEDHGYGLAAAPAPGDITVAGALAIDAHGTAVPALGEARTPGQTYGSLSNLVLSLDAVVWDAQLGSYKVRTFPRSHPAIRVLAGHLGRSFITSCTLRIGANANLRCVSRVDIPSTELFAAPGTPAARTLSTFLDTAGRAEAIWYPFTDKPWLKVWSVAPRKPLTSREVRQPYNYPFSDSVPDVVQQMADELVTGNSQSTVAFGQLMYAVSVAGLTATASFDLWGKSKNLLLYVRPSTLRVTANGYAVLVRRADVQRVLHEWVAKYLALVDSYRARGLYPANMPVEIRVTGLDHAGEAEFPDAQEVALSALRPRADRRDWDVAVWFDVLSFPGTAGANEFYAELEEWMATTYAGTFALMRPEWSKGWAYTAEGGAWTSTAAFSRAKQAFTTGYTSGKWEASAAALRDLDPHGVFTTALHAPLFG